ncbi:MAG: ABC transporter ATP-binding protein, partial [Candidatus Altarchaeaceae archaeon]
YKTGKINFMALKNINLEIEKGEYVSIAGASGSGKSTLLNLIGCLDSPTTGKIFIDGVDTSKMNEDEKARIRRQKIGFVFQQYNLILGLTAEENVALPMLFNHISKSDALKRARELLKKVGLEGKEKNKPMELSGGQQQKVAIARALANNPEILLCDEPTGNLDSNSGKIVIEILEQLNKEGKTLIIVSHDPNIANRAKRKIYIKDGEILKDEK